MPPKTPAAPAAATPGIDSKAVKSLRTRTVTAAKRATSALADIADAHYKALEKGEVPAAAEFRKAADKYLMLMSTLDTVDGLLSPEALEALHAEAAEPGTVPGVRHDDLALLVQYVASQVPDQIGQDGPLSRLQAALDPPGVRLVARQPAGTPVTKAYAEANAQPGA